MKVSLDWLRQYVEIDTGASDLAELLTMAGLEVEAVIDPYRDLRPVIAARIEQITLHPDADNLVLCRVNTGGNRYAEIVCGAPNAEEAMNVACAPPATVLPSGNEVKKTRIRGQISEGMLCSEAELGLGDDSSGLMRLGGDPAPGTPLCDVLGLNDTVFEIGLTPNRPDCLCHIGVAREIAALTGRKLAVPPVPAPDIPGEAAGLTAVDIKNPGMCPRYAAGLVFDIKTGSSPAWLQRRLRSVGLKPVNNIVDITNYVMLETGQPLHAFDFDRLAGRKIVVRTPGQGESSFTTLDGKSRQLDPETLLICDGEKPVAIAGIMGGENSEITGETSRVLIESACFDPICIRKTAKRMGVSTDASYRFERGVDPLGTLYAMNRAARLMAEAAGGTLVNGAIDENPLPAEEKPIILGTEKTNRRLGTELDTGDIAGFLKSIEFSVRPADSGFLEVTPPSFRVDVSRPEDLIEEVARLWGYNRISTTFPKITARAAGPERSLETREQIRNLMAGFGFSEAITYSFIPAGSAENLELPGDDPRRNTVRLLNPLSEEQGVMRTTLLPGLLDAAQKNIFRQEKNLRLFETGKAFYNTGGDTLPHEVEMLAALWTGARNPVSWHTRAEQCDFYDIKGIAESLLAGLNMGNAVYTKMPDSACSYTQPGRTAQIRYDDTFLGMIGEIKSSVLKRFDISQPVFVFEIHLETLVRGLPETPVFRHIPRYPAVTRDVTLLMDQGIEAGRITDYAKAADTELIEDAYLFDLYSGDPIPEGKKSVSLRVVYRSHARTLEDKEVNEIHRKLTGRLLEAFGASLPA